MASPPLIPRQEEGWPSVNWGQVIENTVDTLDSIGGEAVEFFQNLNTPDKSTPEAPPTDSESQPTAVPSDSPGNLFLQPPSKPSHSPGSGASLEINTDQSPKTSSCEDANACGNPVDQIIFTSSCEKMDPDQVVTDEIKAQNQAIWDRLVEMASSRVRKSISNVCDVFFFVALLTTQQRDEILKMPGVRLIIPNAHAKLDSALPRSRKENQPAGVSTGSKRDQMQKRDFISVSSSAPDNMKFVSTPPGHEGLADAFYFYSASGRDTVVFSVGQGVQIGHDEFASHPRPPIGAYLYGLDAGPNRKPEKLATCMASIISGYKTGMLKNADLVPVELYESQASILDSLNQIIDFVRNRERVRMTDGSPPTKGYVAVLRFSWEGDDAFTTQMQYLFRILIRELNVVIVVGAWPDLSYRRSPIEDYPALFASNEYPIIVAGAADLNGVVERWSRSGAQVKIHAPSEATCADETVGDATWGGYGIVIAQAHIGALAAYYLSIEETGYLLRNDPQGVPMATKAWIEQYAWSRMDDGDNSIWNRLGPPEPNLIPPIP